MCLEGLDDVLNFAYVLCFSEIVMFSYRLFYCMKYKLFPGRVPFTIRLLLIHYNNDN